MFDEQNRDRKKKILLIVVILMILLLVVSMNLLNVYAHSGRTDSSGGHHDNSTGEYHYHHGYPDHDHPDGVCPYEKTEEETEVYNFDYSYDSTFDYSYDNNFDYSYDNNFDYSYDNSKENQHYESETDLTSETNTQNTWWKDVIYTVIHSHVFYIVVTIAVWELLKALYKLYKDHQY